MTSLQSNQIFLQVVYEAAEHEARALGTAAAERAALLAHANLIAVERVMQAAAKLRRNGQVN